MENNWYKKSVKNVIEILGSSEFGISFDDAKKRLSQYGSNKLPEAKIENLFSIFFRQFKSPLIYILLLAGVIVLFLKEYNDAIIIFFVLIFNAVIGAIQEGRSRNTLLALQKFVEAVARVLRASKEFLIKDTEVVPGDILILEQGDKIAADARIVFSLGIKTDEAALTGESEPIIKTDEVLLDEKVLPSDQRNMVFKGTYVVAGSGRAIVVATGLQTQIGQISQKVATIDTEIPLQKDISKLSKIITIVVVLMVVMLFGYGLYLGKTPIEMFKLAVSLAVSVIPEGLPIVLTLVLANGVLRMSRRNALVKRLQAVESLGQTKIIAVDKTGTITRNEMMIEKIFVSGKTFEIGGVGYTPEGEIFIDSKSVDPLFFPELLLAGKISGFCANAHAFFSEDAGAWRTVGDPTEAAMAVFSEKIGFKKNYLDEEFPRIAELPFDHRVKMHVVVHKNKSEEFLTAVGAPESIIQRSDKIWKSNKSLKITDEDRGQIEKVFDEFSNAGYRVLAMAIAPDFKKKLESSNINGLTFVGFLAMRDPIRTEAALAIEKAQEAGVKIIMITGDHKKTAAAIARDAGIFKSGDIVMTGSELDQFNDSELVEKIAKASVFARVTPEHKFRIIEAFQKRGNIIAMTGDGVNDAPSLAAADLGVSMGRIGTEVAKEASDIILLDDNLGSIVAAIEEGRNIYKTIKKVILYLFSTNVTEIVIITIAMFLRLPIPLLAAQIIWLNLVTDSAMVIALGMDPKEEDLLTAKFKPSKNIIDREMIMRMIVMALPMIIGALFIFYKYLPIGLTSFSEIDLVKPWTITLSALAVFQWFNAWNCRHNRDSVFGKNIFSNVYLNGSFLIVLALQLFAVYNPFMQKILNTTALNLTDWVYIATMALSVILFEEARKLVVRKFKYV